MIHTRNDKWDHSCPIVFTDQTAGATWVFMGSRKTEWNSCDDVWQRPPPVKSLFAQPIIFTSKPFHLSPSDFPPLWSVHSVYPGLICPVQCDSVCIVGAHTMWCVWYLSSAGLWCCSQGWQRFWLLISFILWPHSHWSCVSQSFSGSSKLLPSTLLCLSSSLPFLPHSLQHFLARSCVLHRCQRLFLPATCYVFAWSMFETCLTFSCFWLILCLFVWNSTERLWH